MLERMNMINYRNNKG